MNKAIIYPILIFLMNIVATLSQPIWQQTNGPCSGQLTSIKADSRGYLYTISSSYDLYRSKDDGENWEKVFEGVSAIAIDVNNNIYLGNSSGGISLYDKDINFLKQLKPNGSDSYVRKIVIDNNSNIYASFFWGEFLVSTDSGVTWSEIFSDNFDDFCADSTSTLILTFDGGTIGRSSNSGLDWNYIVINDSTFKQGLFYTSYNKKFNNFLTAGMGKYVYTSTDNGLTWIPGQDSITIEYVEAIFVDPNGDVYISGDSRVCKSIDGGATWTEIDGFSDYRISSIIKTDSLIFATTWSNGILQYDVTTKKLSKKNQGIINTSINQLSVNSKGYVFTATNSGLYRTTNSGNYWEQLSLPIGTNLICTSVFCTKSGNIYSSNDLGVMKSTNDGDSWVIDSSINSKYSTNLTFAESENGRIYAGNYMLFFSDDNGKSWLTKDLTVNKIVSIATFQNRYVLVGTFTSGIYFSEDEGGSFIRLPLDVPENYRTNVAFNQKGDAFVNMNAWQGGDAIFRSTDTCKTFTKLTGIDYGVSFIQINKNDDIYISSIRSGKLAFSKDNGENWQSLSTGLIANIFITEMCFGNNNDAFLGSKYDGVFKTDELTGVDSHIQHVTSDLQIFPNPASVCIEIAGTDNNDIRICNIYGETVLIPEIQKTENQRIDISTLVPGMYFVQCNNRAIMFVKI